MRHEYEPMKETEQQGIFNEWLGKHASLLFKVVHAYAFTKEDREDLFQNIALQVWRSIPKFKAASAVTTWLYRIALNTAIKWSKKEKKHLDGRQSIAAVEHLLQERHTAVDDRLSWLYEQIAQLNEIDRSLTLLLLDGFSYKEMSKMLGISENNVAVKIHRIKKHLVNKSKAHKNGV